MTIDVQADINIITLLISFTQEEKIDAFAFLIYLLNFYLNTFCYTMLTSLAAK